MTLTEAQAKYLTTIPEDKRIVIHEFDPAVRAASDKVVAKIKAVKPDWNVWPMGSSELGIAGQNDIDINIPTRTDQYQDYLPTLKELFGSPRQEEKLPMKWEFQQDGFDVELYLTDAHSEAFKEHLDTFWILKEHPGLTKRYEELKKSANGESFREYMRRKYEFFNEISEGRNGKSAAVMEGQDLR